MFFFVFIIDDNGSNIRSSQALLEDEWEPEPIEALSGLFVFYKINHFFKLIKFSFSS